MNKIVTQQGYTYIKGNICFDSQNAENSIFTIIGNIS